MLRNYYPTLGFNEDDHETCVADLRAQRTGSSSWPFATTLLNIADALRQGLAAQRQYEHLTSEGISHLAFASRRCEGRTHP
jgi:hypothetical protein